MLTDTHAHIYSTYYENIDNILEESINNGVNRWINNGCDRLSNIEVIDLINKYPNMYGALGIHPEFTNEYTSEDISFIENNINNKKIVAIGEIGLDYHYEDYDKKSQIKLFEIQLRIAEKYNLPVVIHSRDATMDTLNILKKYKLTGVIHSFSGSLEIAKEYIKMGYLLGINGVITFKNAKIKEVFKNIPLTSIILETDSPYLTPEPYRGKQNNPSHIKDIALFVSDLYGVSIDELTKVTNDNIKRVFNI